MKNKLIKSLGTLALLTSSLYAEIPYTNALFGVEGGYGSLSHKYVPDSGVESQGRTEFATIGLKAGAETQNIRTFFNVNYYNDSSELYDYLLTYGMEVQYKFLSTKAFNLYAGVNGGYSQTKLNVKGESFYRTINAPYLGASAGANVSLGNSFDLELGARLNAIQSENIKYQTSYKIENLVAGYVSLIYKWKMN